MIAPWLLYTSALSILFWCIALGVGRILQLTNRPQRGAWFGALVCALVVPVAVDVLIAQKPALSFSSGVAVATAKPFPLDTVLLVLWCVASLIMCIRLISSVVALQRCKNRWREEALDGTPVLVTHDFGPALVGLARPRAAIPEWAFDMSDGERALILGHEKEHARARDQFVLASATIGVSLMPWNVGLWLIVRRLRLAVEMDCDARVLRAGADAHRYAALLLAVGERNSRTVFAWATALAEPRSLLERRISAMISPSIPRRPVLVISGLAVVAGVAFVIACNAPVPDQVLPVTSAANVQEVKKDVEVASVSDSSATHFQRKHEAAASSLGDVVKEVKVDTLHMKTVLDGRQTGKGLAEKRSAEKKYLAKVESDSGAAPFDKLSVKELVPGQVVWEVAKDGKVDSMHFEKKSYSPKYDGEIKVKQDSLLQKKVELLNLKKRP